MKARLPAFETPTIPGLFGDVAFMVRGKASVAFRCGSNVNISRLRACLDEPLDELTSYARSYSVQEEIVSVMGLLEPVR